MRGNSENEFYSGIDQKQDETLNLQKSLGMCRKPARSWATHVIPFTIAGIWWRKAAMKTSPRRHEENQISRNGLMKLLRRQSTALQLNSRPIAKSGQATTAEAWGLCFTSRSALRRTWYSGAKYWQQMCARLRPRKADRTKNMSR